MGGITIVGTGRHAPGAPVTNEMLARVMDTSDEWIRRRTGIEQRHFAEDGMGASDIAVPAAQRAIEAAGLTTKDVDYILFCTMTPDFLFPGSGGLLGAKLGIRGVPALDIRQQCCAMPFALQVANGLVASRAAKNVLIVGAEAHAGFMPWQKWEALLDPEVKVASEDYQRATRHRALAVLFGDGAGAMVVRASETAERGLIDVEVHTDGDDAEHIFIEGSGFRRRPYVTPEQITNEEHIPSMEGRDLFKCAVTRLPEVVRSLCERNDVALDDVDWFVAHQANDRINRVVVQSLGVDPERVPSNIAKYGNTSGATIPILVDEMYRDGRAKPGQLVCFLALGSGLHWGAALMRL